MVDEVLLEELKSGLLTLTLNRPARRNALDSELGERLLEAVQRAAQDPEVRAVLLRGAGGTFCVGGDVKAMAAGADEPRPSTNVYRLCVAAPSCPGFCTKCQSRR